MSREEYKGFLKGTAIKYLWRYKMKGKQIGDMKKCQWYTARLLAQLEKEKDDLDEQISRPKFAAFSESPLREISVA